MSLILVASALLLKAVVSKLLQPFVAVREKDILDLGFFKVVLLGPVIEELLFRGVPLIFSHDIISWPFIISSVWFAIGHRHNFHCGFMYTIPYFIFSAFVYSYITVTWGLEWSIALHVANNALGYGKLAIRHKRLSF